MGDYLLRFVFCLEQGGINMGGKFAFVACYLNAPLCRLEPRKGAWGGISQPCCMGGGCGKLPEIINGNPAGFVIPEWRWRGNLAVVVPYTALIFQKSCA